LPLPTELEALVTLDATLTLSEAARSVWDVVVVGAGPAGALAAQQLAQQGTAVLLVDQAAFPRWKVCGCCLNGRALAVLEAAGLGDIPLQCKAIPLNAIQLSAGKCGVRLPLAGGVSLSREAFDTALVRAAVRAGAAFLPQTRGALPPSGLATAAEYRPVELHQGPVSAQVLARCLLAADGLGGKLLVRAGIGQTPASSGARIGAGAVAPGAPDFYERGTVYMSCGSEGYLGSVRLEDGRLDLAAALDRSAVRTPGGPAAVAARLLEEAGWPAVVGLQQLSWRGTPALTRQASRRAAERLFVVGDAAGYVEPFTGEGMAWALASGLAVAPLAARAARTWYPALAQTWDDIHCRIVTRRQVACRAAALVLRHSLLVQLTVRLLGRLPSLAVPFLRRLNSPGDELAGAGRPLWAMPIPP
jgi:flavin-dependent dehydrogenase